MFEHHIESARILGERLDTNVERPKSGEQTSEVDKSLL